MPYFNTFNNRALTNTIQQVHSSMTALYYIFLNNPGTQDAFVHYWSFPVQPDPTLVPPLLTLRVEGRADRIVNLSPPINVTFPGWAFATGDFDAALQSAPQQPQAVLLSFLGGTHG